MFLFGKHFLLPVILVTPCLVTVGLTCSLNNTDSCLALIVELRSIMGKCSVQMCKLSGESICDGFTLVVVSAARAHGGCPPMAAPLVLLVWSHDRPLLRVVALGNSFVGSVQ